VASEIKVPEGPQDEFPTEDIVLNIRVPIRMDSSNSERNPVNIYDMLRGLQHANDCTRTLSEVRKLLIFLFISVYTFTSCKPTFFNC